MSMPPQAPDVRVDMHVHAHVHLHVRARVRVDVVLVGSRARSSWAAWILSCNRRLSPICSPSWWAQRCQPTRASAIRRGASQRRRRRQPSQFQSLRRRTGCSKRRGASVYQSRGLWSSSGNHWPHCKAVRDASGRRRRRGVRASGGAVDAGKRVEAEGAAPVPMCCHDLDLVSFVL